LASLPTPHVPQPSRWRATHAQELLDGDNQYFCDRCGRKCDALKGFQLIDLPHILTIQVRNGRMERGGGGPSNRARHSK